VACRSTITGEANAAFVDNDSSTLESAGYEQTSNFESSANTTCVFETETRTVSINAFPDGDTSQVAVSIVPTQS
jgi:hypothetical protein